jgi:hypothetical protein
VEIPTQEAFIDEIHGWLTYLVPIRVFVGNEVNIDGKYTLGGVFTATA